MGRVGPNDPRVERGWLRRPGHLLPEKDLVGTRTMEFSHKIAFVIPCYNDGRFIRSAVESAEQCEVTPVEIIIVDNGSTDENTKEVMFELEGAGYRVVHH